MTKIPKPSEHAVQAAIVQALRLAGLDVWETTAYRQRGGSGVDKGVPDLLVSVPGVPLMLGIEVKRPGRIVASTFSSPEQLAAYNEYRTCVARTPREALEHVSLRFGQVATGGAVDARDRARRIMAGFPAEDGRNG